MSKLKTIPLPPYLSSKFASSRSTLPPSRYLLPLECMLNVKVPADSNGGAASSVMASTNKRQFRIQRINLEDWKMMKVW